MMGKDFDKRLTTVLRELRIEQKNLPQVSLPFASRTKR